MKLNKTKYLYSYSSAAEVEQHNIAEFLPFAFLGKVL